MMTDIGHDIFPDVTSTGTGYDLSRRGLLLSVAFFMLCFCARATEYRKADTEIFRIHFRQGEAVIVPSYMNNQATIDSLRAFFTDDAISKDSKVTISTSTSIEGNPDINNRLRQLRAKAMADIISECSSSADIRHIIICEPSNGNNRPMWVWDRFAEARVTTSYPVSASLYRKYSPDSLPQTVFHTEIVTPDTATIRNLYLPGSPSPDISAILPNRYMSLQTNMLYDLAALPSIAFEYYFGKNITAAVHWTYGWWDNDRKHRYWRAYGGDITARYWFGKAATLKPLTGHHAGAYFQTLIYDFEFGGKGYLSGRPGASLWQRGNYAVGVEYGYSLPVSRHFNIDFSIGIGYMWGRYYEYTPLDGHYVWQATRRQRYFGPTKAEISLVWLLGRGNVNRKGGGHEK